MIAFIVSCLTDSDIFGAKSENAKAEFLRFLGTDFDPSFGSALLDQVGTELEQQSQLQEVISFRHLRCDDSIFVEHTLFYLLSGSRGSFFALLYRFVPSKSGCRIDVWVPGVPVALLSAGRLRPVVISPNDARGGRQALSTR